VLQTIRRLLIRSGCFRLERELPGGTCTHDIDAPWQDTQWNKIEHRLFSFISQNWCAKPLVSYRVIVDLISANTTKTGQILNSVSTEPAAAQTDPNSQLGNPALSTPASYLFCFLDARPARGDIDRRAWRRRMQGDGLGWLYLGPCNKSPD
jgi:hypothetical protein